MARCQKRTLLGLVHKAHTTRFGRDHDFRRIRDIQDFRRLVPLRTPLDLWREYWQPAFPYLDDVSWPGPIPYLALSSGTTMSSRRNHKARASAVPPPLPVPRAPRHSRTFLPLQPIA